MAHAFPVPNGALQPTYYEILSITPSSLDSQKDPSQALKRAYHRALLIHHPDKRKHVSPSPTSLPPSPLPPSSPSSSVITIDQISLAYATLSSPSSRSAYDRFLLTTTQSSPLASEQENHFQTGIQDVDLDDLDFDSDGGEWFKACRCGNDRGYRFEERDLEDAAEFGEVMVGCQDCSLWLRVRFAVVDDDETTEDGNAKGEGEGRETVKEGKEDGP
jgi:DnaJ-class molecular chaperone